MTKQKKLSLETIGEIINETSLNLNYSEEHIGGGLYRFHSKDFVVITTEKGMDEIDRKILKDLKNKL